MGVAGAHAGGCAPGWPTRCATGWPGRACSPSTTCPTTRGCTTTTSAPAARCTWSAACRACAPGAAVTYSAVRHGAPRRRRPGGAREPRPRTLHAVDPRFTRDDVRRITVPARSRPGGRGCCTTGGRRARTSSGSTSPTWADGGARARRAGACRWATLIVDLAAGRYPTLPLVDVAADSVTFAVPHDGDDAAAGHRPLPRRRRRRRRPGRPRRRRHRPCDVRQLRHPGPQRPVRHARRRLPAAAQLHPADHARRGRELQQPARQRGELGRRRLRVHHRRAPPLPHPADVGDERRPRDPARPRLPGRRRRHAPRRRGRPARARRRRLRRPPPALLHAPARTSTPSASAPGSWRRCSARPGPSTTRTSG